MKANTYALNKEVEGSLESSISFCGENYAKSSRIKVLGIEIVGRMHCRGLLNLADLLSIQTTNRRRNSWL